MGMRDGTQPRYLCMRPVEPLNSNGGAGLPILNLCCTPASSGCCASIAAKASATPSIDGTSARRRFRDCMSHESNLTREELVGEVWETEVADLRGRTVPWPGPGWRWPDAGFFADCTVSSKNLSSFVKGLGASPLRLWERDRAVRSSEPLAADCSSTGGHVGRA